jgi:hypothetical protein
MEWAGLWVSARRHQCVAGVLVEGIDSGGDHRIAVADSQDRLGRADRGVVVSRLEMM